MARYKVKHNYRSERDGQLVGPWAKGDEIDLDDDVAEYVKVDSPGAIVKVQQARGGDKA